MYNEIINNLSKIISKDELDKLKRSNLHLGIFKEPYLTYMLDGTKTIESRFSKNKIAPYNNITTDDIIIIKESSKDVIGYLTIKRIEFYDLQSTNIEEIKNKYEKELCVDDNFWESKKNSRYATLIFIDKITKIKPFHINKSGMQTWIKLNKEKIWQIIISI